MKKNELEPILDSLLTKLYSYAYALLPDDLQAEQLVIDAYSIFLVREKKFLQEFEFDSKNKKDRLNIRRFLMRNMLLDIFELGYKRSLQLRHLLQNDLGEKQGFYDLKIEQRAVLFLKEVLQYTAKEIQETMSLQKHQVIETLYNARFKILDIREENLDNGAL